MMGAIQIKDKIEKYAKIDEVKETTIAYFTEKYQEDENIEEIVKNVTSLVNNRENALKEYWRVLKKTGYTQLLMD